MISSSKEISADVNRKGPKEDISLTEFLPVYQGCEGALKHNVSKDDGDKSERWTLSSPDCATVQSLDNQLPEDTFNIPSNPPPFVMHSTSGNCNTNMEESDFNIEVIPSALANSQPTERLHDNDATSDLGDDDDFNIEADMFHATLVEKIPSIDDSPNLSETDELLEATIIQNVLDNSPLATKDVTTHSSAVRKDVTTHSSAVRKDVTTHSSAVRKDVTTHSAVRKDVTTHSSAVRKDVTTDSFALCKEVTTDSSALKDVTTDSSVLSKDVTTNSSAVCKDEKPENDVRVLATSFSSSTAEVATDFSSPDMDEGALPVLNDVFFQQPALVDDEIEADISSEKDIATLENGVPKGSPPQCSDEHVVVINDGDCTPDKNDPNTEASSATELLQNVLSLVVGILGENSAAGASVENSAAGDLAHNTASKNDIVQLGDLRVALESVCIEQPVPSSCPLEEAPPLAIQQPTEQAIVKPKKKPKKNKKNKAKVSLNMQSIEAEAYSLFELAKSVLLQARNNNTFSADVDEVITNNAINKRLQLAAFEIGK